MKFSGNFLTSYYKLGLRSLPLTRDFLQKKKGPLALAREGSGVTRIPDNYGS